MQTPRIVSLLASGTEMVAALGAIDQLVGRSHECDYPPAVLALPILSHIQIDITGSSAAIDAQVRERAGAAAISQPAAVQALSLYHIDIDLLRELQPDVIITQTQCHVCAVSERDVHAALQQVTGSAPHIVSLAPYRLADVWEDLRRVGAALGRLDEAQDLVAGYLARLHTLHARATRQTEHPRVAMIEWIDPLMAAGNWIPELVTLAGGMALFGTPGQHSPMLAWSELIDADPDVIILAPCGYDIARTLADVPLLQAHSAWKSLRAVQQGRVYVADGNAYFNRSGPRLVESAEILAAIFGGDDMHAAWWQKIEC